MEDQDRSRVERLRAFVGRGEWDLCVVWELSEDQRSLELKACCCRGADGGGAAVHAGGEEESSHGGLASLEWECRDTNFPRHQRTRACAALAELPPSVPLECTSSPPTSHAQVFLSGIPAWTYPSQLLIRSSCPDEEMRATRVLVPVPGGVVELFVENYVPEDQRTIEFIVSQFVGQSPPTTFAADCQLHRDLDGYVGIPDEHPTWGIQPVPSCDHHSFPWDPPSDQSRLCVSPLNLFEGHREDDAFFEGSSDSVHSDKRDFPFDPLPGFHQPAGRAAAQVAYTSFGNSTVSRELGCHDKESIKQEGEGRTDSFLDGSDQMGGDDDDEQKTGRSDRRPSCKNLMAERKRRKKLNDRLYDLRSLVPKISKMDKASILGDAIEFVKDLQNQVKKLQDQLEETTSVDDGAEFDADDAPHLNNKNNDNHDIQPIDNKKRTGTASPRSSSMIMSSTTSKDPRRSPIIEKKENQMEPQVEVSQVGANKFFLKVFCEHRRGGFVRLMEAMASLGFDVINVNVTTSEPLVLNVFEVEKRDSEVVQADQVRSSLLRLAMDSDDSCLQL